nr:MAG TPA: hypothetical protein [Caudoviricetes sp.]
MSSRKEKSRRLYIYINYFKKIIFLKKTLDYNGIPLYNIIKDKERR